MSRKNNTKRQWESNPFHEEPKEVKPDYGAVEPKPKPRLMTCPSCASGYYSEYTDDCGRASGYCTYCSFERTKPRLGRVGHVSASSEIDEDVIGASDTTGSDITEDR